MASPAGPERESPTARHPPRKTAAHPIRRTPPQAQRNPATDHGASRLRRGRASLSQLRTLPRGGYRHNYSDAPGHEAGAQQGRAIGRPIAANGRLHLIRPRPRCVAELPASRPAQGNPSRPGRCIVAPIMTLTTVETESPLKTNYQLQPCPLFVDRPRAQRLRPVRVCSLLRRKPGGPRAGGILKTTSTST